MIARAMQYRFGPFLADRGAYQLRQGDRPVDVTPKLLDLLFHLLERPATLVTKEELLDAVWPAANVTDNALAQAISELRDALGDSAAAPTYIRTIARRGYRFVAPVEVLTPPRQAAAPPTDWRASTARTIAVVDFENVSGDADLGWLAAGIAETVTNDLSALGGFRVVDRWRVMSASRAAGRALHELGAALGASLVVTGSYQRQGTRVRITARVIDLERGEAVADAKVDGPVTEIFALQDEIVAAFARELGLGRTSGRPGARETGNLDAYRAYIEGWLKLESLDTDLVPAAVADFERAISADPDYAMAYTGLAHARFVAYEMTRVAEAPDVDALASGLAHARRAVELQPDLPEALATQSFLLSSSLAYEEARAAAQKAAALEPDNWRHQFRLGHASWGGARERALQRALALFPQFPYALLETAFLQVARSQFAEAAATARQGAIEQDRQARLGKRYPAIGFHWLTGALESAAGRQESALRHFARELALTDPRTLYGPEYAAAALVGRGFAELTTGQPDRARESFRAAREHISGHVRAFIGEAAALEALGRAGEAAGAWAEVDRRIDRLREAQHGPDALYLEACRAAYRQGPEEAATALQAMLDRLPPSQPGWSIPIEPCFRLIRAAPAFQTVIADLASRAR
jgi:DNA-binding winged helix-turn-helix (wHTH) protein/Tfp pilus assembly protein PilF